VNDGSSDQTLAIANDFASLDNRIQVFDQPNGGAASARNKALHSTNPESKYILFVDSDDIMTPNALKVLSEVLDKNPNAPAVHGKAYNIDPDGNRIPSDGNITPVKRRSVIEANGRPRMLCDDEPTSRRSLLTWCAVQTGTIMARREAMEKTGGFREDFRIIDDWVMLINLSQFGDIISINDETLGYRIHPGNLSKRVKTLNSEVREFRRELQLSGKLTAVEKKCLVGGYKYVEHQAIVDKLSAAKELISKGSVKPAVMQIKYCMGHVFRYVRGGI
jgi:glycosyltransferase involved in cell wall biosynthesis